MGIEIRGSSSWYKEQALQINRTVSEIRRLNPDTKTVQLFTDDLERLVWMGGSTIYVANRNDVEVVAFTGIIKLISK
jgi:hypothetical protein